MAVYIKLTTLKLEKKLKNILEILFFVYIEHVKFQQASFNSNWDIKRWNKKKSGLIPSPHPLSNETKSSGSIPIFTSPSTRWNKMFWINTFTSPSTLWNKSFGSTPSPHPLDATAKKIKMAIYIKSTILMLEKTRNMLEIVFLCILNMLNFKRVALIATWNVKQWNKMFWINTFTSPSTFLCHNFSVGSIPSPHRVHSCAMILKWP